MHILLSLFALLLWLPGAAALYLGMRRIQKLDEVPPAADTDCPSLSVVVAACNERETIEPALRSLLALDYPILEIVVVDDRSTDGTGAVLVRQAAADRRLRVLRVETLPPGWLGKNHALHLGSQAASGDWLLFTDADVIYAPGALRRVMAWTCRARLDHVVALPRVVVEGFWERLFVTYFMVIFNTRFRPWKVRDPRSSAYMGLGAFNLVRAARYRAFGGHAALPLEVADDMKLGKLMKSHGGCSDVVDGAGWLRVRWVIGLGGVVEGLTKNMFAALEFRLAAALGAALVLLAGHVYPMFGLLAGGRATIASALALACMSWAAATTAPKPTADARRQTSAKTAVPTAICRLPSAVLQSVWGLGFPLAALVMVYIIGRSTWLTYRRGGVLWRGTLYPLEELRRGVV